MTERARTTTVVPDARPVPGLGVDLLPAQLHLRVESFYARRCSGDAVPARTCFAGHVTTAMAIDKGIVLLHTNPDQREALWRDPSLVSRAVEEILRAPLPDLNNAGWRAGGTPRYANTDIEIGDVTIKAGDLVLLGRPAANQDELVFPHPDQFDIGREPNPHLAFGHGPHFCLGAPLARIELHAVFSAVPRRVPTLRLAVPVEQLRRRTDLLFGKLAELLVTW